LSSRLSLEHTGGLAPHDVRNCSSHGHGKPFHLHGVEEVDIVEPVCARGLVDDVSREHDEVAIEVAVHGMPGALLWPQRTLFGMVGPAEHAPGEVGGILMRVDAKRVHVTIVAFLPSSAGVSIGRAQVSAPQPQFALDHRHLVPTHRRGTTPRREHLVPLQKPIRRPREVCDPSIVGVDSTVLHHGPSEEEETVRRTGHVRVRLDLRGRFGCRPHPCPISPGVRGHIILVRREAQSQLMSLLAREVQLFVLPATPSAPLFVMVRARASRRAPHPRRP
jgi:hypothetical protein